MGSRWLDPRWPDGHELPAAELTQTQWLDPRLVFDEFDRESTAQQRRLELAGLIHDGQLAEPADGGHMRRHLAFARRGWDRGDCDG